MKYAVKVLLQELLIIDKLIEVTMPNFKDELINLEEKRQELLKAIKILKNKNDGANI